ncbi:lipase family protein [Gordonia soli]|nr:lipase family protein [Gordonia soli]
MVISVGLVGLLVSSVAPAVAEPFNRLPAPPGVPSAINRAVPTAPVPTLGVIPLRARAPGYPHRIQELREAMLPSPSGDPMFDRWPTDLARRTNGSIIASRDITSTTGFAVTAPIASARLVKFRTTDSIGAPSFGTATVIVPRTPARVRGPRPILVHNVPIDSLGTDCTPGYSMAHGVSPITNVTDLFPPTTQLALAQGYSVIIPDHQGPRMAYAEPWVAGHVVLDSIRAAGQLDPGRFARPRIAMTGYSGGAIATAAAAKLVPTYAPELEPRMVGAAIGGLPADFEMLTASMNANLATGFFHAALFGIARERTQILPMANHLAQWLATSPVKNLCTVPAAVGGTTFVPTQALSSDPDPFHSPVAEEIYQITRMSGMRAGMPLYVYHGTYEWWIPAAGARAFFAEQCKLGVRGVYREVPGEHLVTAVAGFGGALTWLDARLRGVPAPNGCR